MTTTDAPAIPAAPERTFYRTAQVLAIDVRPGDVVLDGAAWREVFDVARTPERAAEIWGWTPIATNVDSAWSLNRYETLPQAPKTLEDSAWEFPHGLAGVALTSFDGSEEFVAIRLLDTSLAEISSLTMLAPVASLVTIQVAQ